MVRLHSPAPPYFKVKENILKKTIPLFIHLISDRHSTFEQATIQVNHRELVSLAAEINSKYGVDHQSPKFFDILINQFIPNEILPSLNKLGKHRPYDAYVDDKLFSLIAFKIDTDIPLKDVVGEWNNAFKRKTGIRPITPHHEANASRIWSRMFFMCKATAIMFQSLENALDKSLQSDILPKSTN